MDGDLAILRSTSPSGEVVTTGYGKTSNAGFPDERREVFLDVTPR